MLLKLALNSNKKKIFILTDRNEHGDYVPGDVLSTAHKSTHGISTDLMKLSSISLNYRSGNWAIEQVSNFSKITELVQLNPGSLVLEAKGLTMTPGYPIINPASAHWLCLRKALDTVTPTLQLCCCFLAASWIGGERQNTFFTSPPSEKKMLSFIMRYQHYYDY